ncbi:hypothetical protein [Ignicoccus hospitalis]|uniref:Phosphoesterase, PA-phosphatase related n=1 Tax=Ignicoccus hospitalis (strain KIN4/I / DSM 18386 / JCM 14125) TaxID=453591 RepID=A8AC14_IGNH4|nr:hypothetical protein [Ignicoccus hospitalis]ABU82466.1 hypothetical protein Igni_1290 [Ignicoccus hospitalis KIN4/I]HIH90561.1 hypothetical protein [Desulfurococcaceae archaeon]
MKKERPIDLVLADVISYVFNPYDFGLVLVLTSWFKDGNLFYGILALLSLALLPFLKHFRGVRMGAFDWNVNEFKKRTSILALSGLGGIFGSYLLFVLGAKYVATETLAYALTSLVAAACSRVVKVSIHVATAVTSTAVLGWAFGKEVGLVLVIITVAIAWSRLRLRAHTLEEVLEGYAAAGLGTTTAFLLIQTFLPLQALTILKQDLI